jgi:hypothetical protein
MSIRLRWVCRQHSTERRPTICPHHKLDFRNMNLKVNLVEKIKFDCKCWIVGACRPPASQDGSPSKFCSPLEVVGPRGLSTWTEI